MILLLLQMQFYVDPATGRKFYSKAQVEQYLEKTKTETVSESVPEVAIVPAVAICTPTNVCSIYFRSFLKFYDPRNVNRAIFK